MLYILKFKRVIQGYPPL